MLAVRNSHLWVDIEHIGLSMWTGHIINYTKTKKNRHALICYTQIIVVIVFKCCKYTMIRLLGKVFQYLPAVMKKYKQ